MHLDRTNAVTVRRAGSIGECSRSPGLIVVRSLIGSVSCACGESRCRKPKVTRRQLNVREAVAAPQVAHYTSCLPATSHVSGHYRFGGF
jgi:hypothetical protein